MTSDRRVLFLVENLPVPFDRRVWLEATTLRKAGYTISVICPTGGRYPAGYEHLDGIHVYRYELPAITGTGLLSFVGEYLVALANTARLSFRVHRRQGFDVIHACNPPDLFFLIAYLFKPLRKRFVFDQHDLSPETYLVRSGRPSLLYRILLLLEWLTYRAADTVIATNETVREFAEKRGGVPSNRVFVVRTGPDLGRLHPVPPNPNLRKGASHLVCYLGVMGPQDGVDYALRAAHWIVKTRMRTDIHFALIGSGDVIDDLRRLATDLDINQHVTFTGRLPDDELLVYLSTADVCVSPDPKNGLNEYHTMNKTLEYMSIGKPIVAFDLKETRVSAGDAASYALPNDISDFGRRIVELLDDPSRRKLMGEIAISRLQTSLSWEHMRHHLLRAYDFIFR